MKGHRVQPDQYGWFGDKLNPGEFVLVNPTHMQDGAPIEDWIKNHYPMYLACSPNGHTCSLRAHQITEHEDGMITVSPSIRISQRIDGNDVDLWHGYLEHGIWRECTP